MQINIKLKGSSVSVSPLAPTMNGQGNQALEWKAQDDSDQFNFDDPPISFDSSSAPFSGITGSGNTASATDDVSTSGDYTYHVHLIDGQGNHITWPPTTAAARARTPLNTLTASAMGVMGDGDPTIKNKPL
jgi:hypothetical protein